MLKVNVNLCVGCALCAQVCPQGAISLIGGKAEVDTSKCDSCYWCLEACPRGAISELIIVSPEELEVTVSTLKRQTDDMIKRINRLATKV